MTGNAGGAQRQITMSPSFSLYVTATNVELIKQAAEFGDSITIAGPKGPERTMTPRCSQRSQSRRALLETSMRHF